MSSSYSDCDDFCFECGSSCMPSQDLCENCITKPAKKCDNCQSTVIEPFTHGNCSFCTSDCHKSFVRAKANQEASLLINWVRAPYTKIEPEDAYPIQSGFENGLVEWYSSIKPVSFWFDIDDICNVTESLKYIQMHAFVYIWDEFSS